ncbi:MAG TPA: YggS family pyridoxal phosphate-dependent enzyme, partial [Chitinophagales bacterium]|nr:YggS family pyridoxal phosphate-dependent enzyme [Chitinophagales bacterium]
MVNVAQYNALKQQLSNDGVGLVAVTKLRSIAEIQALYDLGHRVFGENRVQELLDKQQQLPQDIEW